MTDITEIYEIYLKEGQTLKLTKNKYTYLLSCKDVDSTVDICFVSKDDVKSLVAILTKALKD